MTHEGSGKYLIFTVDEPFAVDLAWVSKIIEYQPVTQVPEVPAYIAGVVNLFGQVVPVLNLRTRLKKADAPLGSRACIIILDMDGMVIGLIADEVLDIIAIAPEAMLPPPQTGTPASQALVQALAIHGESVIMVLDSERLVGEGDLGTLTEAE